MRAPLVTIPLLALLVIFQSAVVSRMPLLHGQADVVLLVIIAWSLQERVKTAWPESLAGGLMTGFVSAYSVFIPVSSYLAISALARAFRRRIWQMPVLVMLLLTLFGTLLSHGLAALVLLLSGTPLPWGEALRVVTLPSLILNLLLAAPIYALARDLAEWLYPDVVQL